MKNGLSEQKFAWTIIFPALIIVFGIVIYPLFRTLIYSFQDMNLSLGGTGEFIGLANYMEILGNGDFWASAGRTAYFSLVSILVEVILGVMIALLLNEDIRGKSFLLAIIIIPWAVPNIVSSSMWKWILHPEYGALNALLMQLHIIPEYQSWLGSPWLALNMVIIADAWKMTPLVVIFMLSALKLTNKSVYEAAVVDGAGLLRRFTSITLPYLKPMLLVIVVMRTMETFKVFDLIYVLTQGGPANGTMVLGFQAYAKVFENLNYSAGATYSYLIALIIALLTFIYIQLLKREGE
ncbi:carbohydrate ABC transporter permease [Tuberibacillus sp. Marseille-P3662]|uniref:carbohydrate ABC transporter permease n=1 Tax=Tuberibacillus sp. Marseille-P3662 TaxID=1965358 RepID=UPI000A1CA4ED|nr:sugar ABC transporter permease [Tuberibacillus sp. Marseille-P3662]